MAKNADAAGIAAIIRAAFEEYRGRLDPPSGALDETAETVLQKLREGAASLAVVNGEVAASVFQLPRADHVYLSRLAVTPRFRRQGIGRALVELVEEQAKRSGFPRVQLGVRLALPELRAYYVAMGYRPIGLGTHDGYRQATYEILEKTLESAMTRTPT
jgi:GNAT superfamily N-acetyltransferase